VRRSGPVILLHGGDQRPADRRLSAFVADVVALIDVQGAGRVDLVGHSLGAHVASAVAQRLPDRVDRQVLDEPPAPGRDTGRRMFTGRADLLGGVGMTVRRSAVDRATLRSVIRELQRPHPDWWADLSSIRAHTLVVAGGSRSHIPQPLLAEITAEVPDARLVTIDAGPPGAQP
jgi:esterase